MSNKGEILITINDDAIRSFIVNDYQSKGESYVK